MSNESKKQEAIRLAYGDCYEKVKQFIGYDGWCVRIDYSSGHEIVNHISLNDLGIFQDDDLVDVGYNHNRKQHIWRPKSLQGIEDNNGWISINCKESLKFDLHSNDYWILIKGNSEPQFSRYFNNHHKSWIFENITHYQPIIKPQKPIY